ncbi:hypothetical protein SKAU_G00053990 [Synaphobranchus kaupii]|uniref:Uncharacterized protein n=1 Tax=Synaphobranchus kaupii TaxID=118154 RepID=A0A9Q1J7V7_SYNKA|nr:hypothetical protein SKAU_G00053990 [Synaphobranchus kaupii]
MVGSSYATVEDLIARLGLRPSWALAGKCLRRERPRQPPPPPPQDVRASAASRHSERLPVWALPSLSLWEGLTRGQAVKRASRRAKEPDAFGFRSRRNSRFPGKPPFAVCSACWAAMTGRSG